MKGLKRYLALFLSLAMLFAYTPAFVFADTEDAGAADAELTEQSAEETEPAPEDLQQEEAEEAAEEEQAVPAEEKMVLKAAAEGTEATEEFSYIPVKPIVFTEGNSEGYTSYDENDEEYFRYYTGSYYIFNSGDVINLKGVEYKIPDFDEDYEGDKYFEDPDGNRINVYDLSVSDNQYDNHWTPGTENAKITIEYYDEDEGQYLTCEVGVTIAENPIKKISFEFAKPLELIVDVDGYMDDDGEYDEETGEWVEASYFRYSTPGVYTEGNKLIVNDVVYTYNNDDYAFVSKDGDRIDPDYIYVEDDQSYKNQWSLTNPGKITVTYKGKKCVLEVKIIPNPVQSIAFEFGTPLELIEEANGSWTTDEIYDEETDSTKTYKYFWYNTPGRYDEGNKLTINGTDVYTLYYDDGWVYRSEDGKTIDNNDVYIEDDQSYKNQWSSKNPGHITVKYKGRECVIPVTIKPNPVKTISFEFAKPAILTEGVDGWNDWDYVYDEDAEKYVEKQYFRYSVPSIYKKGNKLTVNGEVYTYKYDLLRHSSVFKNADGSKVLDEDYLDYENNQSYSNQWSVGTNKFTVTYMGRTCEVPVTVQKASAAPSLTISFQPASPLEVYENASGYMRDPREDDEEDMEEEEYAPYFHYEVPSVFKQGCKLTVNGKAYTYDAVSEKFINGSDAIDRNEVRSYTDQGYKNPWSKTNSGNITIEYKESTCTVPVKVVDNPVKNIEFKLAKPLSITEYSNGYTARDYIKQDDGTYSEVNYFYYYTPYPFREGSKLIVDGVEYTYSYNDDHPAYISKNEDVIFVDDEDGYPGITYDSDQSANNPWTASNPGKITVTYMGRNSVLPVTVNKTNVTSISYEPVKPLTVYENYYGWWEEDSDGNEYFYYDDPFSKRVGDKLIVNGTAYTYQRERFEDGDGYFYDYYYKSESGQQIYTDDVDFRDNQSNSNRWSKTNPGKVTVSYGGKSFDLTVNVIDLPVTSIQFKQASVPRIMENTGGDRDDYDYDDDYFRYTFPGFHEGDQLTVNYSDGRGTVVYTAKNVTASGGYTYLGFVSADGKDVIDVDDLDYYSDQRYRTPWGVGDHEFTISYFNKEAKYKVTIYESDVASIAFTGAKPITVYEGYGYEEEDYDDEAYFDYNIVERFHDGDRLTITHKNGTKTEYTYKRVNSEGYYAFLDAKGNEIIDEPDLYEYQRHLPWKKGEVNEMLLRCFGMEITVPVEIRENPVASITPALSHPVIVKSENASYRRDSQGEIYKRYRLSRYYNSGSESLLFVDGDKVIVKFKDNTQKTFTYNVKRDWFIDEDGNYADLLDYEDDQDQYKAHWTKGGNNPVYMTYLGVRSTPIKVMIDEVIEVKSIADATVTAEGKATYTGNPVEQSFKVVLGDRNLVEDYDYNVTYENNINAGTAIATLHGINSFTGTKRVEFTISPKAVTPVITLDKTEFEYNGKDQRPSVTVTVDGKPAEATLTWPEASVGGGTYTITATLSGNYTGTGSATYTIKVNPADQAAAEAAGKAAEARSASGDAAKKAADAKTAAAGTTKASAAAVNAAKESVTAANEYLKKANAAKAAADAALAAAKATGKQALIDEAEKAVAAADADVKAAEKAVNEANTALAAAEDAAWNGVYNKKLAKVSVSKLVKGKKSMTVKWKKLSKKQKKTCDKIEVQYSLKKKFPRAQTVTKTVKKTKTSLKIKKLKSKKTYYVRIRTIKTVDGIKQVGKWSKVKKVKVK